MKNEELKQILSEMEDKLGRLRPEDVVKAASNKDHPLHNEFEWNNVKAGHQYRLNQARTMIRAVKVDYVVETTTIEAPAYVRNPDLPPKISGYVNVQRLRRDRDAAHAALTYEFARAGAHLRRARDLARAMNCAEDVEELISRFDAVLAAISPPSGSA